MSDCLSLRWTIALPPQRSFVPAEAAGEVESRVWLGPAALAPSVEASDPVAANALRIPIGTRLDEAERVLILATLAAVSGSKVKAAEALGISLKTLYNRLHAYRAEGADAAPKPHAPFPLSEAA
jgi:DNA-binding NtrC family response regulator